jgi:hypothetical protein
VIAHLEEDYDFSQLSVVEQGQAKKWYKAEPPTSSRKYGTEFEVAYTAWLKWNPTNTGKLNPKFKGGLIIPLFYEAGPIWHREREEKDEEEGGLFQV